MTLNIGFSVVGMVSAGLVVSEAGGKRQLFLTSMSSTGTFVIFCIIQGTDTPFSAKVPENATVDELKQEIQKTDDAKTADIDHSLIDLYRIDVSTTSGHKTYIKEVRSKEQDLKQDLSALVELDPTHRISKYYTSSPPEDTVHILVVCKSTG